MHIYLHAQYIMNVIVRFFFITGTYFTSYSQVPFYSGAILSNAVVFHVAFIRRFYTEDG